MKKVTVLAILIAFVGFSFAQKQVGKVTAVNPISHSVKTPTDTIMPESFAAGSPTLYGVTGGGYIFGTNTYGDLCKAQMFLITDPTQGYNIEGVLMWAGAKEIKGTAGNLNITIWNCDGPGKALSGDITTAPGTVKGTKTLTMDAVDTALSLSNISAIMFDAPIAVASDYAIGIDMTSIGDDTVGVVSTTSGDAGGTERAWEKWSSDNTWYSMQAAGWSSGALDVDMAMFPIINVNAAGVQDFAINGIIMNIFPNPSYDVATIEYSLTEASNNVVVRIHDNSGRIVKEFAQGAQNAGQQTVTFSVNDLASGSYFYSINAGNGNMLAKRFSVK